MLEDFDFIQPLPDSFMEFIADLDESTIGRNTQFFQHDEDQEIKPKSLAVFGVTEWRDCNQAKIDFDFVEIRKHFYRFYQGNWKHPIVDLGDVIPGETKKDTFFAVKTLVKYLLKNDVIPIILGGEQDITFAQYRAYDEYKYMVNLAAIDAKFDLGDAEKPISSTSYLSHMIVDEPYNLFNFANIGYQTYYVKQEEIQLLDKLYFEANRLGEITADISSVEPIMRDSDLLSLDISTIKTAEIADRNHYMVNGFSAKELCSLARYAGLSDKITSFGIYELQKFEKFNSISQIAAQIIWYFIEGVNFRFNENLNQLDYNFVTYKVPVDDQVLVFYESEISGRWWIEIPQQTNSDNKLKHHALLPCTKDNYLSACNQEVPERWFRAKIKNEM
ncbi:MAG: formimidoylglutamase [Bacteroidota bacterium]